MTKSCLNCKWFYNTNCNCKELINNINIQTNKNGITYFEEGIFSETIKENFNFKELTKIIINKLKHEDYLKKNKNINNFDIEELSDEIIELIDDSLSSSIMNYFDNDNKNIKIAFSDTNNFNCCYWE